MPRILAVKIETNSKNFYTTQVSNIPRKKGKKMKDFRRQLTERDIFNIFKDIFASFRRKFEDLKEPFQEITICQKLASVAISFCL